MTIADLTKFIGKPVCLYFKGHQIPLYGTLGYVDEFSSKHHYRKPGYFYINNMSFKVSAVRKVIEREEKPC